MVSPTLARAMQRVDEEAAASDAVMAEARASIPAADPALANLPRFPSSDPKEGESRSRVYILISKQGNTTKFARDSIVSSVELELEAAGWESSPGLPAIRQCPDTVFFPVVIDKGGAEKLRKDIDLFDNAKATRPPSIYSGSTRTAGGFTIARSQAPPLRPP